MKISMLVVISVVLMIGLTFFGYNTALTEVGGAIGFGYYEVNGTFHSDLGTSSIYLKLLGTSLGIFTVAALVSAVTIGFFTKSKTENFILIPFVFVLAAFISSFLSVIKQVNGGGYSPWMAGLVGIIFIPISVAYLIALADWWRGTNN